MDLWLETVLQKVSEHAHRCETDLIEDLAAKVGNVPSESTAGRSLIQLIRWICAK